MCWDKKDLHILEYKKNGGICCGLMHFSKTHVPLRVVLAHVINSFCVF